LPKKKKKKEEEEEKYLHKEGFPHAGNMLFQGLAIHSHKVINTIELE
jgi:hypothetical protein